MKTERNVLVGVVVVVVVVVVSTITIGRTRAVEEVFNRNVGH